MDKTTWEKISDRITAMSERNRKMDDTAALINWDDNPYKLVAPDGKTEIRDAISVTPNLPKVFAHSVIADLMSGKWQSVVEGSVSERQAHRIEEFIEDSLSEADENMLARYGIPSLNGWLSNHVCLRWAIGVRWVSQVIDGKWDIDCLPVDMRWTPFVRGRWVAPVTSESEDDLREKLEQYEKVAKNGAGVYNKISFSGQNIEVRDYWSKETHELWISGRLAFSEKNTLGYPPFTIVVPASGFMFRDPGYLKHEGEDILFLNAGLYKEFARSISLEQTSGYAGLYPGYEYETTGMDAEPSASPPGLGQTQKVPAGERHLPVPRGDINRAGQTARADLLTQIEAGGPISPRQYNTPPSAVLLAGETELISRLQNARKDALEVFGSQLSRMMIDQFIKGSHGKQKVGRTGLMKNYSAGDFGDPENYTISRHLSIKSKRQELANLAEFAAVYDKLPLKWNLANILMADDPDGIITDLELQRAKSINPALGLIEMALKYARAASEVEDEVEAELKKIQSKILTHEYVMAMRQRLQPSPTPAPQPKEPTGSSQLLTQLGGAAGALRGDNDGTPQQGQQQGVIER